MSKPKRQVTCGVECWYGGTSGSGFLPQHLLPTPPQWHNELPQGTKSYPTHPNPMAQRFLCPVFLLALYPETM